MELTLTTVWAEMVNIKQRVEWVKSFDGKYCACCGAVHKKEPHKKDCVYFKNNSKNT